MFYCSEHSEDQRKGILLTYECVADEMCMIGFHKFDPVVV